MKLIPALSPKEFKEKHPNYKPPHKSKSDLKREEYMRKVKEKKLAGENF